MSTDRLLTALSIGLLATSLVSSMAAFHIHSLELEKIPHVSDRDLESEIGALGMDFLESTEKDNSILTDDIYSLIKRILSTNSTSQL